MQKKKQRFCPRIFVWLFIACGVFNVWELGAQCDSFTPSFTANLVGIPGGTVIIPNTPRSGTCCGITAPDVCIKITILLDPGAMGIDFQMYGAPGGGASNYKIGCGPSIPVDTPVCLNGPGPHILTFCKPGANINSYGIISLPKPKVPDSILVRNGCTATLATTGFLIPSITWNSIAPGLPGAYNSYLNCTSGCATVIAAPSGTPPAFVDYLVSGFAEAPCLSSFYQDTVRVYYYTDLLAGINPLNPTICFGNNTAVLTVTASGGLAPYTYTWSNAVLGPTNNVGPGTYTVFVGDATGCPPTQTTSIVSQFTSAITANTGPDRILCKTSPSVSLNGTIGIAPGGIWSGGSGVFSPSTTALTNTYVPTLLEVSTGSVQLYLMSTGNAGCPPGYDTLNVIFQNPSVVNTGINPTVCANNNLVILSGTVSAFPASIIWSSLGTGTFASLTNSNTSYLPSLADILTGSVQIVITTTNNGACPPAIGVFTVNITPRPVVNAGPNQLICSTNSAALSGTVSGPTSTGSWTTTGDGTFSPGNSVLNATYSPGPNDINTGTVNIILVSTNNGNCLPESDTLTLSIRKIALVNSGLNQLICSSTSSILLTGSVTGGTTSGVWSASGAGGFFPSNTSLTSIYVRTAADSLAGVVFFTLTSASNGPCPFVQDSLAVFFQPLASVFSGSNQFICSSQGTINLNGTIVGASGTGSWTASGGGSFLPGNTALNTSYSIVPADVTNGSVTFTLTSTGNGVCPAVSDTVIITIRNLASVYAGPNQTICSTSASVVLSGSVTGGTFTSQWSASGAGGFNPGSSSINTSYLRTNTDSLSGFVIFTLTSTNNGPCPAVSDSLIVFLQPLAVVSSGSNQLLCSSQGTIALNGAVIGAAGTGSWNATGGGIFSPGNSALLTSYSMTTTDITSGFVTFTLTSTNNGVCPAIRDTVKIGIGKLAVVNASSNQTLCSTAANVVLSGTVLSQSGTGIWLGPGGSFNPGPQILNTSYVLTPTDISTGSVALILTSLNNGPCPAVSDTVWVQIVPLPLPNAGTSSLVCSSQNTLSLSGTVSGFSGTGIWSASGSGAFFPGTNALNTTYTMTSGDITLGSVIFTLTSTNTGVCPSRRDTLKIMITKLAQVYAGLGQSVCSPQGSITLAGTVNGAGNSGVWQSLGNGTFVPGSNALATFYQFSPTDVLAGSLIFTLTSTNNGPCPSVKDTLTITLRSPALINIGPSQSICSTQKIISLNGNVSSVTNSGIWLSSGSGSFGPNATNFTPNYTVTENDISSGSLTFTLISTNNGACPVSAKQMVVTITKLAVVNAGLNQKVCTDQTVLNLNGLITGASGTGSWTTTGDGNFSPTATSLNSYYYLQPSDLAKDKILMILTSTNNDPCPVVIDTLLVEVFIKPQISIKQDTTICEGQSPITLVAQTSGYIGNLLWSSNGTGVFLPNNSTVPGSYSVSETDVATGLVTIGLSALNNGPCANTVGIMKLNINRSAKAAFYPSATQITLPADPVIFTNQSTNASGFNWDFGDGTTSSATDPSHSYNNAAYFTVVLIARNKFGCNDTASAQIIAVSDIRFPNAFTPNPDRSNGGAYDPNDLSNDVFFPFTDGVTEYDLTIFNRWGELIFRSTDLKIGWDGYFNGKICQQDAYVWKADVKFFDGRVYNKTGSVTLLR